jgi:serine/threonine protein kinase/tetratricopeptide (TPR) repeat protein
MNIDPDAHELFPDVDAAGGLRAGFSQRHRSRGSGTHTARAASQAQPTGDGGYELHGEIARGGMGVIVKAFDRELARDVALKVLREELAAEPRLVQRFLAEARVTARLDHPGIVPVHEVGRDAHGRAYFAMRLVRGRELKRIIDLAHAGAEGWNRTRALSVIQKVCEAMAYAHGKGVIHRDLKPSNVMVGEFGEVYVMDWGLARVIGADDPHDLRLRDRPSTQGVADARELESPIVTMDGDVLGTPCYMAPEQAQGRIADLGPRSDVYSVGAMLYHLLAGEMPYVPAGTSVASRTVLAQLVRGPPRPLHELQIDVPAELIAIADKAMSRAPEDRYPDMLSMAEDLRAFLEGRVVRAHETGGWAEARKWVQRNKALSGAMSLAVAALVIGLLVSLALKAQSDSNFVRAEKSAHVASDERDRALTIASFLEDTLKGVGPSVARGRDTTMLRELMDGALSRVENGELSAAPEAELRLMLVIGEAYEEIARYEEAEALFRTVVSRGERAYHGDHALIARAQSELGAVLRARGDLDGAESVLRQALAMRERLFPGDHPDPSETIEKLALVLEDRGDFAAAEPLFRRALAMRERMYGGDHESTAIALGNLGGMLRAIGDLKGADAALSRAVDMQERVFHGDHPALATNLDNLAAVASARGDAAAAEALTRRSYEMRKRIYPGDHPILAVSVNNLALVLADRGDAVEAERLFRESIAMQRRLAKGDDKSLAEDIGNLGGILYLRGDLAGAEPLYRESLAMLRRILGSDHPSISSQLGNLAVLLKARGDFDGAEALYRENLAMQTRLYPGDHPDVALTLNNLASLLDARGDQAGAEALYREAIGMQTRLTPAGHPALAQYEIHLANVLQRKGDLAAAESFDRHALEMQQRLSNGDSPELGKCFANLASVLGDRGDSSGAETYYREALRIYGALLTARDPRIAATEVGLGRVLSRAHRFAEADDLFSSGLPALADARCAHPEEYDKCLREAVLNCTAWEAADPSVAQARRLSEWKRKLSELQHE